MTKQDYQVSMVKRFEYLREKGKDRTDVDAAHLVLRLTGNYSSRLPQFTFFSPTAFSSNYSAQWFRMRETTTPYSHSSRLTFCRVFPAELKRDSRFESRYARKESILCIELIYLRIRRRRSPLLGESPVDVAFSRNASRRSTHRMHDVQAWIACIWHV